MEPVIVEGFDASADSEQIRRLLGQQGPSTAQKDLRLEETIAEAEEYAITLLEPRGIYTIVSGRELAGSGIFAHLEQMAFCVCTIGPRLEEKVAELGKRGELLRAVVLDAVGSASAEAAADRMEKFLGEAAALEGLAISCRASPGYGDWDVSEQRAIFELVPAHRIGVTLSAGCMMIPRKSVSFAVHISREPQMLRSRNSCDNCNRRDCAFRASEAGRGKR